MTPETRLLQLKREAVAAKAKLPAHDTTPAYVLNCIMLGMASTAVTAGFTLAVMGFLLPGGNAGLFDVIFFGAATLCGWIGTVIIWRSGSKEEVRNRLSFMEASAAYAQAQAEVLARLGIDPGTITLKNPVTAGRHEVMATRRGVPVRILAEEVGGRVVFMEGSRPLTLRPAKGLRPMLRLFLTRA